MRKRQKNKSDASSLYNNKKSTGFNILDRVWPIRTSTLIAKGVPGSEYLRQPAMIWAATLIINLAGLVLPFLILQVYDRIIPNASIDTMIFLVFGFIGFMVLEFILKTGRAYLMGYNVAKFQMIASHDAAKRFTNLPFGHYSQTKPQKHAERLRSIMRLGDFFGSQNCLLVMDLPFVLLYVAVMGLFGGFVTLVPIIILCIFVFMTIINGRKISKMQTEKIIEDVKANEFLSECLRSITSLKGFAMEALMMRRFERLQRTKSKINFNMMKLGHSNMATYSMLGSATVVAVVTVGAIEAALNNMSLGILAACTLLASRIVQPIVRFAGLWNEFQTLKLHLDDVTELFSYEKAQKMALRDPSEKAPNLRVENLVVNVPSVGRIGPINLTLDPGSSISMTGRHQRTKTIILQTLAGLIRREEGQIYYNDIPIDQYRSGNPFSICFIGQETAAFQGTILENLTLFNRIATLDDVRRAIELTGLNEDISRLPLGYDTSLVGETSESLTEGLVRRIILARALATKPKVIILDEPQMYLAAESDERIQNCLKSLKGEVTLIISSTRSKYLQIADQHYTISDEKKTAQASMLKTAAEGGSHG